MRLIFKTYSSDDDWNGDCDWAAVDLTKEFALEILERVAAFKKLKAACSDAYHLTFWNCACEFFSAATEELQEWLEGGALADESGGMGDEDFAEAPAFFDMEREEARRTEMDIMHVDAEHVWWSAHPKHTGVLVETRFLPLDVVRRAAEV